MIRHHDWRAIVGYRLTDAQASALAAQSHKPGAPPLVPIHPSERAAVDPRVAVLDVSQVDPRMSHLVCLACEVTWEEAHTVPCPGEPVAHDDRTGEPIYSYAGKRLRWAAWAERHR